LKQGSFYDRNATCRSHEAYASSAFVRVAADGVARPEFVHEHSGETALIGRRYEIFYRGRFNAYRKPVDPQAAHCAGKA
ncbi:MAG: hypothetical protein AAGC59_20665, partial [Brucella pseudogrignonensis]